MLVAFPLFCGRCSRPPGVSGGFAHAGLLAWGGVDGGVCVWGGGRLGAGSTGNKRLCSCTEHSCVCGRGCAAALAAQPARQVDERDWLSRVYLGRARGGVVRLPGSAFVAVAGMWVWVGTHMDPWFGGGGGVGWGGVWWQRSAGGICIQDRLRSFIDHARGVGGGGLTRWRHSAAGGDTSH